VKPEIGETALVAAGCALLAVPLLAHVYAGTGSRYVGDDYCAAFIFRDHGLLGGQRWFYMSWGAVPTTLALMALTHPGGVRVAAALPAIAILAWVVSATWTVRTVSAVVDREWNWLPALLVGELLVYTTVQDAPNVIQSLYLRVPMLEYTGPLVAATAYAGVLAYLYRRRSAGIGTSATSAIITFVAGSFGPIYVAVQTAGLALAAMLTLVVPRTDGRRVARRLLLAGLIGSLAALAFIVLAPGNAGRQTSFPHPPGLVTLVVWSVLDTVFMLARPALPLMRPAIEWVAPRVLGAQPTWLAMALGMSASPFTLLMAVGIPAALTYRASDGDPSFARSGLVTAALFGLPVLAFGLVAACMAPAAYGMSTPPPPRALIVPSFVIMSCAIAWGCALGVRLRASPSPIMRVAAVLVVALAVCEPLASTTGILRRSAEVHAWADRWDETDRQLRAAAAGGRRSAVVPAVGSIGGVGSISSTPDWVNNCAAQYYGLESVIGTGPR
jgi:hypothetical protein